MSMQGSAMMYVTAGDLYRGRADVRVRQRVSSATSSGRPLDERRLDDHLVEAGRVRAPQARRVGVVREAEDRDVRDRCRRPRSGRSRAMSQITRSGAVGAVGRDELVPRQERLELAAEEEVDPHQQDRRHG